MDTLGLIWQELQIIREEQTALRISHQVMKDDLASLKSIRTEKTEYKKTKIGAAATLLAALIGGACLLVSTLLGQARAEAKGVVDDQNAGFEERLVKRLQKSNDEAVRKALQARDARGEPADTIGPK